MANNMFQLTLFPFGGHLLVAKDFTDKGMLSVDEEKHESPLLKTIRTWRNKRSLKLSTPEPDVENLQDADEKTPENSRRDSMSEVGELVSSRLALLESVYSRLRSAP